MPRTSVSALEVLSRQVRGDSGLDAFPEVRANLLTRIRGLQRTDPDQEEQDLNVVAVLIRRDVLVGSSAATPEAAGLRVRQSEQLLKLRSARRRGGRPVPVGRMPLRKPVPRQYRDEDEEPEDNAAGSAAGGE